MIMARPFAAAATMASLLLGGCGASLQSRVDSMVEARPGRAEPLVGATYSLPMLAYELKITRSLAACPGPVALTVGNDDKPMVFDAVWTGEIDAPVLVQATPRSLPGERFRYDPGKLKAISKTTAFKMTYHPGGDRLAGINATLDDQTGAILGDVAKAGLAVASVALGPATGGASLSGLAPALDGLTGSEKAQFSALEKSDFLKIPVNLKMSKELLAAIARAKAKAALGTSLDAALIASSDPVEMIVCTDAGRALLARKQTETTNKSVAAAAAAVAARRAEALLAVARVRRLSQDGRDRLEDAAAEAARQLDLADAAQAAIVEIDTGLSAGVTATWPKSPGDRVAAAGRYGPAAIDDGVAAARRKFGPLLERRTIKLLNPYKFALALQANRALRDSIGAQATAFLDGNGEPRRSAEKLAEEVAKSVGRRCRSADGVSRADFTACGEALITPLTAVLEAEKGASLRQDLRETVVGSETVKAWDDRIHKGLLYRLPVAGHFTLCKAADATTDGCPSVRLLREATSIPQLGALRVLPLKNGMFQNTGLVANFDASGNLTDVAFNTSKAIAANAAAAAAAVAKDIKDSDEARRKQAKEAETAAVAKAAAAKAEALADAARAEAAAKSVATAERTAAEELAKDLTADANVAKVRLTLAQAEAALLDYATEQAKEDQ